MDVPAGVTWDELKALAANRQSWRKRVQAITGEPEVEVKLSGKGGIVRSNLLKTFFVGKEPKPAEPAMTRQTRRYRARDEHEVFFRSGW